MDKKLLQVKNLKTHFYTSHGVVKAVDDISFEIEKGEVFGLVGESGSGKTLTALSILRLVAPPGKIIGGHILFNPVRNKVSDGVNGVDLFSMDENYLRSIRGSRISIVFQEPSTALNPVFTVGHQVAEVIVAHQKATKRTAKALALELLNKVHIPSPEKVYYDYPHQLSGGAKQRACIAMALANSPELLILDEPTTALDVSIQAQILDLLDEIIEKEKLSILFISHDFGIVARMCGHVGVMHQGKIVEMGDVKSIMNDPKERYTISLLESVRALS